MKTAEDMRRMLGRALAVCAAIAVAGAVLSVIGAFISPARFFESYWLAFHFWFALTAGSIALTGISHFFNADWSLALRNPLHSAMKTIIVMLVLFIPALFAMKLLFEWTIPEIVAESAVIQRKAGYLNVPFFLVRALIYFILWAGAAWLLMQWNPDAGRRGGRPRVVSVIAMIVYFLTMTFAAVDWAMSIHAEWFSTGFSLLYIIGQCLTTFAFVVALILYLARYEPVHRALSGRRLNDWGNFLLMFVMLWAYLEATQFIIIWSGNLQVDNTWYWFRARNGWQVVGTFIILCNFFLPFTVLLFRTVKRRARWLFGVAVLLLCIRFVEMYWVIIPSYHRDGFHLNWLNIVVPIAMGGIWMTAFLWDLRRRPIVYEFAYAKETHG